MIKKQLTWVALFLALAFVGGSCNTPEKLPGNRSPSAVEDDRAVEALNAEILKVTDASQVSATLGNIKAIAASFPNSPAAAFYSELAQLALPLQGVLWRLGGVAVQSEMLYSALVGAIVSVKQSNHLYSRPLNALLDWATNPVASVNGLPYSAKTRLTTMKEFQDFLTEYARILKPATERIEAIYTKNAAFEFWFHRELVSPQIKSTYKGRRVRFIRPYLAAGLSASYYSLATIKAITAYNLDDLPVYLNETTHEQLKGTGLGVVRLDARQRVMAELNKVGINISALAHRNVTVNTSMDYGMILRKYPNLFTWRGDTGRKTRDEALPLIRTASHFDIEWATQMQTFADGKDQEEYIVDANLKMADPVYKLSHYREIDKLVKGPTNFIDPVTGDPVNVNFPAVFTTDRPLRYYLPTDWLHRPRDWDDRHKVFRKMVNGLPTFDFELGLANAWNDPTFGGLLPGATSATLREMHRKLLYNDDSNQFMGTLLYFFL